MLAIKLLYYKINYDTIYHVFVVQSWGIGVDDVNGFIYWNDNANIKQATLNGSTVKVITKAGMSNVK